MSALRDTVTHWLDESQAAVAKAPPNGSLRVLNVGRVDAYARVLWEMDRRPDAPNLWALAQGAKP